MASLDTILTAYMTVLADAIPEGVQRSPDPL